MGTRIHRIGETYRMWSSTVDAYITPPMNRDEMIDFYLQRTASMAIESAGLHFDRWIVDIGDKWRDVQDEWSEEEIELRGEQAEEWADYYASTEIEDLDRVVVTEVKRLPKMEAELLPGGIQIVISEDIPKGTVFMMSGNLNEVDGIIIQKIENVGDPE